MIESIEISNFRGFDTLEVSDLRRINVIAGANAAGKSALLEAIVFGVRATPVAVNQIALSRGVGSSPQTPSVPVVFGSVTIPAIGMMADQYRAIVDGLFHNNNTRDPITVKYIDSDKNTYSVSLAYVTDQVPQAIYSAQQTFPPMRMVRIKNDEINREISINTGPQGQLFHDYVFDYLGPNAIFFPSNAIHAEADNVTWFSALSQENREQEVIELVSQYFPTIKSLSVLSPPYQGDSIWADLGNRKLPVSSVSSGLHRFLSILLGMISTRNGIVVIDEIENGMYYKLYPKLWEMLFKLAETHNNQVFVSTHSLECLKAIKEPLIQDVSSACLLRVRQKDGHSVVNKLADKLLEGGITGNVEMRG